MWGTLELRGFPLEVDFRYFQPLPLIQVEKERPPDFHLQSLSIQTSNFHQLASHFNWNVRVHKNIKTLR